MSLRLAPYSPSDLSNNPRLSDALQQLNRGNVDAAIADLASQAAKALPGSAFLLAAVYFQQSRFADAITVANKAEELKTHSGGQTLIGAAHLQLKRSKEAFQALQRALVLDWQNHQAHRLAWTALIALGLFSASQKLAQAALEKYHVSVILPDDAIPIDLTQITLCAIDCANPALAAHALRRSARGCRFGAIKLLTSMKPETARVTSILIDHLGSAQAYSEFVVRELHRYIDTEFALITQWDGYVINPLSWNPKFLDYDYIGARWTNEFLNPRELADGHDVGNGGFSLRSRRFLTATAKIAENPATGQLHPEDGVFCRRLRPKMESEFNIRFAPGSLADQFSFEHALSEQPTFGFHGVANIAATINDPAFCRFEFLSSRLDGEGRL